MERARMFSSMVRLRAGSWSKMLDRIANGELEVLVSRRGEPVAWIVSAKAPDQTRQAVSWAEEAWWHRGGGAAPPQMEPLAPLPLVGEEVAGGD